MASALGLKELLLSTGRRSERLGFALYPFLPPQAGIQVADFAAFSLRKIGVASFSRIFWVCFPGKLLKLAQGLEWTHAGAGAADIPLLADLGRQEGAGAELASRIADMPTAVGAFALLEEHGRELHDAVLLRLGRMAYANLRGWLLEARSGPAPGLSMTVFSTGQEPLLTIEDGEERLASTG